MTGRHYRSDPSRSPDELPIPLGSLSLMGIASWLVVGIVARLLWLALVGLGL